MLARDNWESVYLTHCNHDCSSPNVQPVYGPALNVPVLPVCAPVLEFAAACAVLPVVILFPAALSVVVRAIAFPVLFELSLF